MLLNQSRADAYLDEVGLDALIATSPANITYLTDFSCWLDPLLKEYMIAPGASTDLLGNYGVYARGGDGGLVIRPTFGVNIADCWVSRHRFSAPLPFDHALLLESTPSTPNERRLWDVFTEHGHHQSPEAALASLLQEMGLDDARLGVDFDGLSRQRRDLLRAILQKNDVKHCSNLLRLVRMVKSDEEQQRLTRSAQINEQAGINSLKHAEAGVSIREMIRQYRVAIAQENANLDHYAYTIDGLGIATQPDYTLRDGDALFVDFGCIHGGQFSDTGTTLMVGGTPDQLLSHYMALAEALAAGQEAATVGATASTVHKEMASIVQGHGLSASVHGHSLGLEVREYPIFRPQLRGRIVDECVDVAADLRLEAGMIFNLEAPLYLPPTGSFQIEKTFIMTDAGCLPLFEQDRSGPVICN